MQQNVYSSFSRSPRSPLLIFHFLNVGRGMSGYPRLIGSRLLYNRHIIGQSCGVPLLHERFLRSSTFSKLSQQSLWLHNSNRYASLKGADTVKLESTAVKDLDPPIQYTTSGASKWTAAETHFLKVSNDWPDFQPYLIIFSVSCMLLWFGIFREENDIDEEMKKPLWERIDGLEKVQIETLIKYNTEHGITTIELEERLAEINALEIKRKNATEK